MGQSHTEPCRVKLAWFTPFPPEKSAIAEYSWTIVEELQKSYLADLWISVTDDADTRYIEDQYGRKCNIIFIEQADKILQRLEQYDAVIYNMGNNMPFHRAIFDVSQRHPGIVILHDYVLHHFFAAYYLNQQKRDSYVRAMETAHGENGKKVANDILSGARKSIWNTDEVIDYPLNYGVIEKALGVIVHSNFVKAKLERDSDVLVRQIDFPAPPAAPSAGNVAEARKKVEAAVSLPPDGILLLTFGEIIPNKRIDAVLKVLGENRDLAARVRYVIIGRERYDIGAVIDRYGLQGSVMRIGYQPRDVLDDFVIAADLCINLRYPTMGESSWSLLQAMFAGKPSMVTRVGWYDELPDDCVVKIDPDSGEELSHQLRRLCEDGRLRNEIGGRARAYAMKTYSTELYCKALIEFVGTTTRLKVAADLIDAVSHELSLMGVGADSGLVDGLSGRLFEILKK